MYQKLILIGNLGSDPELRFMPDGQAVANFSLAQNSKTGSGEDITTWFRVSVWGKPAENANEYLHKGSKVLVEGVLKPDRETGGPRVWQDNNGTSRASFEMTAFTIRFLDSRQDAPAKGSDAVDEDEYDMDDIPF